MLTSQASRSRPRRCSSTSSSVDPVAIIAREGPRAGVGQSRLRPRPGEITVRSGDAGRVIGYQCPGRPVLRVHRENFRAPSAANAIARGQGERDGGGTFELDDRQAPNEGDLTVRCGGPQTPQTASPGVLSCRKVGPPSVAVHSIRHGPAKDCASLRNCTATLARRFVSLWESDRRAATSTRTRAMSSVQKVLGPRFGEAGVASAALDQSFRSRWSKFGSGGRVVMSAPAAHWRAVARVADTAWRPPAMPSSGPIAALLRPSSRPGSAR